MIQHRELTGVTFMCLGLTVLGNFEVHKPIKLIEFIQNISLICLGTMIRSIAKTYQT